MSSGRKRVVLSCVPCYTRKQKCNRQYPCNNCARRRCPEDCAYYPVANQASTPLEPRKDETRNDTASRPRGSSISSRKSWTGNVSPVLSTATSSNPPLADLFGYFEDSDCNTLALIRKMGMDTNETVPTLSPEAASEVNRAIQQMPDRQTLDFLIRYFIAEVNWMDQLIHPPWFLTKYRRWWTIERVALVADVDFAILILRICSYASQFLPSPSYTLDRIRGTLLSDLRDTCDEVAECLTNIGCAMDGGGSLIRVQHLAFYSLRCQMEGRRDSFWDALSRAIRVARSIGIHSETANARLSADEIEKEMGRRTFCNLHVWDSLLARQTDRAAFLPGCLSQDSWPQMYLGNIGDNGGTEPASDTPEPFTERLLQTRLADFWRQAKPTTGTDMMIAEERYERFCREYLAKLPSAFALQPSRAWDKHLTKLPLQRQLLHIAIYDSLCWNFRTLLLRLPQEQGLPAYKRLLLDSQKKALIVAALYVLQGVSKLHSMLGGCHTRFAGLVFPTFEAAILLVYLCMEETFPSHDENTSTMSSTKDSKDPDPLRADIPKFTRHGCIEAAQGALDRLCMLAEVSSTADVGAGILTQLLSKVSTTMKKTTTIATVDVTDDTSMNQMQDITLNSEGCLPSDTSDPSSREDFLSTGKSSWTNLSSWSSFDPTAELNGQDDFLSLDGIQESQDKWGIPVLDFDH